MSSEPNKIPADHETITHSALSYAAEYFGCSVNQLEVSAVTGGFTRNRRSLVGYNGSWIFAKEVDISLLPDDGELELGWLKKEHDVVQLLRTKDSDIVAEWSLLSPDGAVLLTPACRSEDGWLWRPPSETNQQQAYIEAVIQATTQLESLQFSDEEMTRYGFTSQVRDDAASQEKFIKLLNDDVMRGRAAEKIRSLAVLQTRLSQNVIYEAADAVADASTFDKIRQSAEQLLAQPNAVFGHCDVRSDNLAYQPASGGLRLVDWNWASFTPGNFGSTEFLANMVINGIDVQRWESYLNRELLAGTVGLYAYGCLKPELKPGGTLRQFQAESAVAGYQLYKMTEQKVNT